MPPARKTLKANGWTDAQIDAAFEVDRKDDAEMRNYIEFCETYAHRRVDMIEVLGRI